MPANVGFAFLRCWGSKVAEVKKVCNKNKRLDSTICFLYCDNLICFHLYNSLVCSTAMPLFVQLSEAIGNSERIRSALSNHQVTITGKTKAIAAHCPTRFAIMIKICHDVSASQAALRAMVESDEWKDTLSALTTHSDHFKPLMHRES